MSISDAIKLTLRSSVILKDNEIAILDMGKPVNISNFVKQIIRNYGFLDNFNQKIKINYIGLRFDKVKNYKKNFFIMIFNKNKK